MGKDSDSFKDNMKLQPQQKLVFIGDSITDAGRTRPDGEGLFGAIGTGYVQYVDALLNVTYPEYSIRVINKGNSGNTVRDLKERWDEDVLQLKPDWLSIMIGINDVWRQFDSPRQIEQHVGLEEYEATLRELVEKTQPQLQGLVMAAPFFIESQRGDAMRALMDKYGAVVRSIAEERNAVFVDTQAAFNRVLEHQHSAALAWDRVHPNHVGTMIIAKAWLDAVGFEW
jgi:lysophospholipase L1-like esterase